VLLLAWGYGAARPLRTDRSSHPRTPSATPCSSAPAGMAWQAWRHGKMARWHGGMAWIGLWALWWMALLCLGPCLLLVPTLGIPTAVAG
jgi:hypothetical protein